MRSRLERLAVIGVILAVAASCDRAARQRTTPADALPDEVIRGFVTEETDSGRVQWRLSSPAATRYHGRNEFMMERPRIEFFDDRGGLRTVLEADSGRYDQLSRDLLAWGHVVVTASRGDVLETDSLHYVNARDVVETDAWVRLTRGNDVVTGYGLECDRDLTEVHIRRDMRARIVEPPSDTESGTGTKEESP